jgi:hypothetical protein
VLSRLIRHKTFARLCVFAPPLIALIYIALFSVDVPALDDFSHIGLFYQIAPDLSNLWQKLWFQHQEYRMLFLNAIWFAWFALFNVHTQPLLFVSWGLMAITALGLWRLYRRALPSAGVLGFVPIVWLVFSLAQYESLLWAVTMHFHLASVGFVWMLVALTSPRFNAVHLFGAAACALLASYSYGSGMLAWVVGACVLLILQRRALLPWLLIAAAAIAFYFFDYTTYSYSQLTFFDILRRSPLDAVQFF